jgi:hypothetical protein
MLAASMINRVSGQELLKSGKPWINLRKALWAVAAAPAGDLKFASEVAS